MVWIRHNGGRGWRVQDGGFIELEGIGREPIEVPRTKGAPTSMRLLYDDHGCAIDRAAGLFQCYRWEERTGAAPDGEPSVGLMQTLLSTANEVERWLGLYGRAIDVDDLKSGEVSIMLGAGYLHLLSVKWGRDPVRLCVAYNAGGVYTSSRGAFRMRTYGEKRVESFAAWYNDAVAVLGELEG